MKLLAAVLSGGVLSLAGLALLLPLPEIGLPLLLIGLRLLGQRFEWARRANRWVDHVAHQAVDRYHQLPIALRLLVLGGLVALAVLVIFLGIRHSPW